MTYEKFLEAWNELSLDEKIALFNEYAREYNPDDELFAFDEDFFNTYFDKHMDAVRACFFGNIKSWGDEYIRFNGYANLVSMSDFEAEKWADDYTKEIFEHSEIWSEYIDEDEEEEEEE